jgi:TonB family protein
MAAATAKSRAAWDQDYYTWSFPGCPVQIRLDLALVDRIRRKLTESSGQGRSLLLGQGSRQGGVEITDDYPILGGSLASAIPAAQAAHPDLSVVGYWRVQADGPLRLEEEDHALALAVFNDPHSVFLLIQAGAKPVPNACFFFWDGGRIDGDVAILEFPFDPVLLSGSRSRELVDYGEAVSGPVATGQPVRRRVRLRVARLAWLLAGLLVLASAAIWIVRHPGNTASPVAERPSPAREPAPAVTFSLAAERAGSDLRLLWDRNSPLIRIAVAGNLSITDGDAKREIGLEADQLRTGSVFYSPTAEQIQMRLTVVQPDGQAYSESVLVLLPRTGAPTVTRTAPVANSLPVRPEQVPRPRSSTKPFRPPPRPQSTTPTALDGPPALALQPSTAPAVIESLLPPTDIPVSRPSSPAPAGAAPLPKISAYSPPVALVTVAPPVNGTMKELLSRPVTVSVTVSIDETGKVVKAEASAPGVHRMLVDAAIAAARKWKFRPAGRGGVPIPSEFTVNFVFKARP